MKASAFIIVESGSPFEKGYNQPEMEYSFIGEEK